MQRLDRGRRLHSLPLHWRRPASQRRLGGERVTAHAPGEGHQLVRRQPVPRRHTNIFRFQFEVHRERRRLCLCRRGARRQLRRGRGDGRRKRHWGPRGGWRQLWHSLPWCSEAFHCPCLDERGLQWLRLGRRRGVLGLRLPLRHNRRSRWRHLAGPVALPGQYHLEPSAHQGAFLQPLLVASSDLQHQRGKYDPQLRHECGRQGLPWGLERGRGCPDSHRRSCQETFGRAVLQRRA
mmetsp:Transcript_72773/g.236361  ORF Transcript_72773/g.236361 Transcript_72773/m.236361 type:complete len:236 (+) Transcript_72773:680-1387(+)